MPGRTSRALQVAPDNGVTWKRVDPDVRRQTWVQVCDVNSAGDGTFACDITVKEKDPSYQKPLTGGYSQSKLHVIKLQWQPNGDDSGGFKSYFTYGDSQHDGSYLIGPSMVVKDSWSRVYKSFPKEYTDSSGQIGILRIWGSGAPPSTFLGNVVATLTVTDKYNCRWIGGSTRICDRALPCPHYR